MRTIKFRGKILDSGEWAFGCYTWDVEGDHIVHCVDDYYVDPKTVGEYLGRNDLHNNKIYEGDIVKDQDGCIWEVKFNEKHPYWIPFVFPRNEAPESFEIVGNIHDNPELLEVIE